MRSRLLAPCCLAFFAAYMFAFSSAAQSATLMTRGLTQADVQNAIDAADDGDPGVAVLTCAGKKWAADQWRGYSVFNTTTGKSSMITSSTENTIVARIDSSYGGANLGWNTGDGFKIERCLVALDQMGRGQGKLISGDTPAPAAWPEQVADPTYVWNNTLNGRIRKLVSSSPHVKEGADFFNGTPKPGYRPYTYPHPLVTSMEGERR